MMSKFVKAGEMELRGKTLKLIMANGDNDPLRFFCMVEDVEKLLSGDYQYVRLFEDGSGVSNE